MECACYFKSQPIRVAGVTRRSSHDAERRATMWVKFMLPTNSISTGRRAEPIIFAGFRQLRMVLEYLAFAATSETIGAA